MIYAVIDTNVIVSAFVTKTENATTSKVLEAALQGKIIPIYNDEILSEYNDVLSRRKFNIAESLIVRTIDRILEKGVPGSRIHCNENFPDPKDVVFYEVALSKKDAYLVTGNSKHFPKTPIVVTPAEMLEILQKEALKQQEGR
ncbi:MAG: putative toxin-antitoxin system toxin component, PIN family [Paludibacteraceae bacterium]|nr:putative toxin-antitoxin system toxin component, PIN family [Paludibacteraceae bacterium]